MTQYYSIDENNKAVGGVFDIQDGSPVPNNWRAISEHATIGAQWDDETSQWEAPTVSIIELRAERDRLLLMCDFTQLADCSLNPELKNLWGTYRQSLRDLPSQYVPTLVPEYPTRPDELDDLLEV